MEKFIVTQTETAVYEVNADSIWDATNQFQTGGGDFLGWEDDESSIKVEKEEEYARRLAQARR